MLLTWDWILPGDTFFEIDGKIDSGPVLFPIEGSEHVDYLRII